ncbi:hypothetical protein [Lentzea aerocolonigenes]|uniref:hypothetical protein n=1 Tax=Lentzea aerocolonigenes TaxID=68170 RepID=UPI0012DFBDF3|nr:hypothetical protein [Lentzea aerocolonigenes]
MKLRAWTYRMHMDEHLDPQLELIYDGVGGCGHEERVGVENGGKSWSYEWEGARNGGRYLFASQVSRAGGVDGERRRLELTAAVRELLHWAGQQPLVDKAADRQA